MKKNKIIVTDEKIIFEKIYKINNRFTLDVKNFCVFLNKINIILGENGAGKSTLLNVLLENDNYFQGHKKIMLTQNTYTFNRTCLKNIEMVLKWNKSNENPLDYLKMVDLEDKKDNIGNKLSGGEKKRLAFAMALATKSNVFLLDEPFANIDKKNQLKLIEIIKNLKGKKTIILVSHRTSICKEIGDYFTEMEDGKLIKSGSTDFFEL